MNASSVTMHMPMQRSKTSQLPSWLHSETSGTRMETKQLRAAPVLHLEEVDNAKKQEDGFRVLSSVLRQRHGGHCHSQLCPKCAVQAHHPPLPLQPARPQPCTHITSLSIIILRYIMLQGLHHLKEYQRVPSKTAGHVHSTTPTALSHIQCPGDAPFLFAGRPRTRTRCNGKIFALA